MFQPQHAHYFNKLKGLITDYGSLTSHPTILAREHNIPCIVGTGNATDKLRHGQKIKMIVNSEQAQIIII
jgi:pyruvate,water dikinase